MQSFRTTDSGSPLHCHSSFLLRGDDTSRNPTRFSDPHRSFQQQHDAVDLSSSTVFGAKSNHVAVVGSNLQYGTFNTNLGSASTGAVCIETGMFQKGTTLAALPPVNENWGDSGMADNSQKTEDTSTDIDTDDKNQCFSTVSWGNGVRHGELVVVDSKDKKQTNVKAEDHKTLRRLAQNREAARKSRLRKKAYVQQLENSRLRLAQIEQELQRARQQGAFVATGVTGDHGQSVVGNGN